ncbi:ATP-binding protein [Gimesia aquarii]|uniref:Chromosome partition protein Smc n=1 Tax=Gimesia aquarii TaxID=2527964 RepID=A0A517W0K0_9PLAN|nr:ATP-binding protein [Gimesia aquarii]QDT98784.1 Chromosome partition protein Smc [Gimesia aquarii]
MQHLCDLRPDRPGYRLQKLEVFNWGTFDSQAGTVFCFEPKGRTALLVGHNGSGKSTLVDALLTLLVDGKTRNYNVAAGAKKTERTPKSYIKGAFDRTTDESNSNVVKFLRPQGNHLTAISAVFSDEQLGQSFTLTQILYLKADGSDDRVYAIANESHELKSDLQGLQKSDAVREHLKQQGYQTTRAYTEYLGWITKRTQMRSKAIDMFNQTVAVKDIQSLNVFIRRHMLEAQNWHDKVQGLLKHFNDLSIAHNELVRAQQAQELLLPVESIGKKYRRKNEALNFYQHQLDASESYFPQLKIEIFEPELRVQNQNLKTQETVIKRLDQELEQTRETVRQTKNEIEHAGGERLRQIPGLIRNEQTKLDFKRDTFQKYHKTLKTCGINDIVGNAKQFQQINKQLCEISKSNSDKLVELKNRQETTLGQKTSIVSQLRQERADLDMLQKQHSNLPPRFSTIRSQLCADLGLDESLFPFAAELISVLPDQQNWTASIEMVLRSFALSLLVPEQFYPRVRAYVEGNRIIDAHGAGQRLDYLCVGKVTDSAGGDRIHPQSLCNKLQFKPRHNLTPWLRTEIQQRFNFHCCNSIEEFNDVSKYALTAQRHVKYDSKRHQKDDRERTTNPRFFILGWDNTDKKSRIRHHIQELESEIKILTDEIISINDQIEEIQNTFRAADAALDISDFDKIDIKRHQDEIVTLEAEKKNLEESNKTVQTLQKRLKQSESEEQTLSAKRDLCFEKRAKLKGDISRVTKLVALAHTQLQAQQTAGNFDVHHEMFETIAESLDKPALSIENFEQRIQNWRASTQKQIDKLRSPLEKIKEDLISAMSKYLRDFKEAANDLDASLKSLDSFQGLLNQLRLEDLPRYERQFKNRLNDQVSQEIALFNTELRTEQKLIEDKITQLNNALKDVEYSPGTYMRLKPHPVNDREIEDFRRSLRECLDDSLEQTPEANEARFVRIKNLVERLSDKEKTNWRKKVIDVRNWYDFAAEEIELQSGLTRSCYDGSSGQSGGEKAKLAFTILVAALAYQFDIDPVGNVPGRFQFVVVDEMFSKVDDQNAEYALKLFNQFGLQLLIVAPLDAKARVTEPFVDRYLHVVKDPETNCSILHSMTAREYDEVVQKVSHNARPKANQKQIMK